MASFYRAVPATARLFQAGRKPHRMGERVPQANMAILVDKKADEAMDRHRALVAVKVIHTAFWGFFASCIMMLPLAAWWNRFDVAAILVAIVLLECGVLALNKGRCPLTDIAARYTSDRSPAFDIYLP